MQKPNDEPQQYTREERLALARGSLTPASLPDVYAQGTRDFLFALDPTLPLTRPLSAEEEKEWRALWEKLLRMDRVTFWGPLRGGCFASLCHFVSLFATHCGDRIHLQHVKGVGKTFLSLSIFSALCSKTENKGGKTP